MSFNVTFYSFSKKLNSTKRPGTSIPSTTYNCDIKDSSKVTTPVLLMSYDFNDKINSLYNYCYIDIWKRYYFIKNFRYNSGLWEISLGVDVLATWKTYIGNSSQYIARSASKNNDDKYIDDLLIPTWHTDRQPQGYFSQSFFGNNPGGSYVLGVKGPQPASNAGAITYYTLTQTGMNKVIETLCDSAFSGYKDIGAEMLKSQYDRSYPTFNPVCATVAKSAPSYAVISLFPVACDTTLLSNTEACSIVNSFTAIIFYLLRDLYIPINIR